MSQALIELSHQELSMLLFALEGGRGVGDQGPPSSPSCEEACPIVEDVEELFSKDAGKGDKRLARHLSNHLREGLIETGMFELMGAIGPESRRGLSAEEQARLQQVNERLKQWTCEIKLDSTDRLLLAGAFSRLPRTAWLTMPRTMWNLRRKLRSGGM